MRVLLDEQLPRHLARYLTGHDVTTVQRQGDLKNGELLRRAAEDGFDVFVTADQNLEFQQNLARLGQSNLRVVVLAALSNVLEDLVPLVPELLNVLPGAEPGRITHVRSR